MKKIILLVIICVINTQAFSQWSTTGNAGTNATTNFIGTTDNIAFKVRTNNVVRMTVNGSGKVGIGITSPVGKLHVKGNTDVSQLIIDATSTQTNANPLIRLRKSDGTDLMWIHSDGIYNSFIGVNAGRVNVLSSGGNFNTFVGGSTGYSNTSGANNSGSGCATLYSNTTGGGNTTNGAFALFYNSEGSQNTAIGLSSLYINTKAGENTAIGAGTLYSQSYNPGAAWVSGNTAVGNSALYSNEPTSTSNGIYNTAVGHSSLRYNTTGYSNTASGASSLYTNTIGYENTAIGVQALFSNLGGNDNTAIGYKALRLNSSGSFNTATGMNALYNNPSGNYNTASGVNALYTNTNGTNNSATGVNTLFANNIGSNNAATGNYALVSNTSGSNNTAHGMYALNNNTTGSENTAIGYNAITANNNLINATAIGARAYAGYSNSIVLGSVNGLNGATSNVNVGIGTYLPVYSLDVTGTTYVTGNFFNSALSVDNYGVYGACNSTPYFGYGVAGVGGFVGVYARASYNGTGSRYGVMAYGESGANYNYGVRAYGTGGSQAFGVYGYASGATTDNWGGYFVGHVYTTGLYYGSDRKLKKDIKPLNNAMEIINRLNPSVYNFKTEEYKQMNLPEGLQYGLIADEVQQVLPGAVKKTVQPAEYENHDEKNGKKVSEEVEFSAINYVEIIPILISGMKEQQKQIEKSEIKSQLLEEENEMLKNEIAEIKTALGLQTKSSGIKPLSSVFLEQNSPNPFNTQTEIKFSLPVTFTSAQLIITDANGRQVRKDLFKSSSSIIIKAAELSAGTYSYSLVIDGINIETRQMVLTK